MRLSKKVMMSVGLFIILVNIFIFFVIGLRLDHLFMKNLEDTARAFYKQIIITRAWVAMHGGVYVKKRPGVEINPYLPSPFIISAAGDTLVLRNPALVTRELSELSARMGKRFQFHLTSLKPINPANLPSPFEREALLALARHQNTRKYAEYTCIEKMESGQFFRYFAPLYTEESCLTCHGRQGYKVGDIRGGISILIPIQKILAERKKNILFIILGCVVASIFVSTFIFLIFKRFIISPLRRLESSADRIRQGDYASPIGYLKDDEIGDLGRAMEKMQKAIHRSTESILYSERKYRQLLEHSPEAILITDAHDTILEGNEKITRLSLYPVGEIAGKPISTIMNRNKRVDYAQPLKSGENSNLFETELIRKDGETIPIEVSVVDRFSTKSPGPGKIYYLHDISSRKRMEQHMLQSEKMYALGQLSAGIAHEIRNPLFAIRNDLDYLRRQNDINRKYHEVYEEMDNGLVRMGEIVQSILDFARPHPLAFDFYDLKEVIDKSLMLIGKQLQKNQTEIRVQMEEDIPKIEMDAHRIEQVFVNLLTNAMRATAGKHGRIDICAKRKGKYAVIHVMDNGVGISATDLPRIFDPFFTLSANGTGLGLSIARKIIEQHHGYIRVQSTPGKGTQFTLQLPLQQS